MTSGPDRFDSLKRLYIGAAPDESYTEFYIDTVRDTGRKILMKLVGVDNPEDAKLLHGMLLMISDDEVEKLPPGEYYEFEIVGCTVQNETGKVLGRVVEILPMPAQDVYVVESEEGSQWWLPASKSIIREIDVSARRISIEQIDGIFETGPAR